jgi:hypothetical protein
MKMVEQGGGADRSVSNVLLFIGLNFIPAAHRNVRSRKHAIEKHDCEGHFYSNQVGL